MAYTISDNLTNLFGTQEVSLTVNAYFATDLSQVPTQFMVPPTNIKVQATTIADSSGNFVLNLPLDQPIILAANSVLSPNVWYWSVGRNVDYGITASGVPAIGVAPSKVNVAGDLGVYNSLLTKLTSGNFSPLSLDVYGRLLRGNVTVNLINRASAADTGIATVITYDNTAAFYDVSMFDEISIKFAATASLGGTTPTATISVDLIDAQNSIYTIFTGDAMVTTAGALTLARLISIGKSSPVSSSAGVVQGIATMLVGMKMRIKITGGGGAANTSLTYSLAVDAR